MTERTFIGKTGDTWTWEETPETIEALKQLHESVKKTNEDKLKRPHDYPGPLYAPHPDLVKNDDRKETN